jgi:hypothetical protein
VEYLGRGAVSRVICEPQVVRRADDLAGAAVVFLLRQQRALVEFLVTCEKPRSARRRTLLP